MTSLLTETPDTPQLPEEGHNILSRLIIRIDCLVDELTKDRDERRSRRKRAVQPVANWVYGAPVGQAQPSMPAAGALVLDLGGPQMGREWEVTRLAVSDAGNVRTALAGTADWYIGKAISPSGIAGNVPVPPTAWMWVFPNLPNLVETEQVITPSDRLYCVITGAAASQNVLAKAAIRDYNPVDQIMAQVF